jgi:hypothetical protein
MSSVLEPDPAEIVIDTRADFAAVVARIDARITLRGDGEAFFLTSTVFACEPQAASTITSDPAAMAAQQRRPYRCEPLMRDLSPLVPEW